MSYAIDLAVRYLLVVLFFPFSALDKILNFRGAVDQAKEIARADGVATALILAGLAVEILMPLGILTGVADRLAAFIMAGYCGVTALLWKRVLEAGRFLAQRQQQGARPVLGFPQELLACRRLPADNLRPDQCLRPAGSSTIHSPPPTPTAQARQP